MLDFLKLRPADNTAAGIAAALERANAARIAAQATITEAKQKRDALLLDGQPAQMTAAEKTLAAAREEAERIDALVEQLAARLPAAQRADALAKMDAKLSEMRNAAKAMETWWSKNGASR